MKILITGSHFTPAQAVIEEFEKDSSLDLVYIGRKHTREGDSALSVESQVLPKLGVKFIPIISGRLQRSFTIYTIPSLFKIPIGFLQSFYFLIKEKPDVVLSFGGYVAVPVIFSAWLLGVPVIIHEQTLISGLANTISSWFADKIAVSFADNSFSGKQTVLTGNPLRRDLLKENSVSSDIKMILDTARKEKLPIILITGGNQGSHIINSAVSKCLDDLTKITCVVHQTGDSKFLDFENLTQQQQNIKHPQRYLAKKWIEAEDVGSIFKKVDLVISRAGINTLLELAYFGVPALIIPIPYIYKDEQNKNAKFFEKLGLAKILSQKSLSGDSLLTTIKNMIKDEKDLKEAAKQAKNIVIPDAAKRLALETLLLSKKN